MTARLRSNRSALVSMSEPYASDLTPDWSGFCNLWRYVGAHLSVYGHPPHYRKTVDFLARGGFTVRPSTSEGSLK